MSEFAESLSELAPLAAVAPPAALRDSVLATVVNLRQAGLQRAPRSADRASQGGDDAEVTPRRALLASVTEPGRWSRTRSRPRGAPVRGAGHAVAGCHRRLVGRHAPPLPVARSRVRGLLAVALVAALVLGGWVYVSQRQLHTQTTQAQQETDLLTAPDAEIHDSRVNGSPVSYVVSKERNQALFIAKDLADPGDRSIYQLWTVKDGTATSAGVVSEGGDVREWLTGPVGDSDELALSLEPAPLGSKTPTNELSAVFSLSPRSRPLCPRRPPAPRCLTGS